MAPSITPSLQVRSSELRDAIIQERDSIRDLNTKLRIHAVTEQTAAVSWGCYDLACNLWMQFSKFLFNNHM